MLRFSRVLVAAAALIAGCGDSGGSTSADAADTLAADDTASVGDTAASPDTTAALPPVERAASSRTSQIRYLCECKVSQLSGFRLTADECVDAIGWAPTEEQLTCVSDWLDTHPDDAAWLACFAGLMEARFACIEELGCEALVPTFACANGVDRVDPDKVCDAADDCPDGSDEVGCTNLCDGGTYGWTERERCDIDVDCADGADEVGCDYLECDGETYPAWYVCDDTEDCDDGSDEVGCTSETEPDPCPTVDYRAECGDESAVLPFLQKTSDCGIPYIRVPYL